MIRSMLYASDLGPYAPFVLQHALSMARAFKADLYVIHAVEPMSPFAESVLQSYLDPSTLDDLHHEGVTTVMANIEQKVLDSFVDELEEPQDLALISAVRVRQGDPAQVILDQVQRLEVDLLIIGSHGEGGNADIPLGRTAARVLQLSPVPVYLVPLGSALVKRGDGEG
jgi:nucleotide-binding universal stress UspA family protein